MVIVYYIHAQFNVCRINTNIGYNISINNKPYENMKLSPTFDIHIPRANQSAILTVRLL